MAAAIAPNLLTILAALEKELEMYAKFDLDLRVTMRQLELWIHEVRLATEKAKGVRVMTAVSVTRALLPWHIAGTANPNTDPRQSVWGPTPPGSQSGEWIAKDIRPANAEFVVRACNAHDDLLAAARNAAEYLREQFGTCESDCTCLLHPLEAAVQKAEGR